MNDNNKKNNDPAVLFFTSDWLVSTMNMSADCRGWYINLLCHQHDKKELPNDLEQLAVLANVTFSDFKRFSSGFDKELREKFETNENGKLVNPKMNKIMQERQLFIKKRSNAGKIGFLTKVAYELTRNDVEINYLKDSFNFDEYNGNKQVLKEMLKQMLKHYRDENEDENVNKGKIEFDVFWNAYDKKVGKREKIRDKWNKLTIVQQEEIMVHIPKYIISQPDKQFRSNPETYLNNDGWKNEIIIKTDGFAVGQKVNSHDNKERDY